MVQDSRPLPGNPRRSPGEQLKRQILCDRLRLTELEIESLLQSLRADGAGLLGIPPDELELDVEFNGRELDFLFRFARPFSMKSGKPR